MKRFEATKVGWLLIGAAMTVIGCGSGAVDAGAPGAAAPPDATQPLATLTASDASRQLGVDRWRIFAGPSTSDGVSFATHGIATDGTLQFVGSIGLTWDADKKLATVTLRESHPQQGELRFNVTTSAFDEGATPVSGALFQQLFTDVQAAAPQHDEAYSCLSDAVDVVMACGTFALSCVLSCWASAGVACVGACAGGGGWCANTLYHYVNDGCIRCGYVNYCTAPITNTTWGTQIGYVTGWANTCNGNVHAEVRSYVGNTPELAEIYNPNGSRLAGWTTTYDLNSSEILASNSWNYAFGAITDQNVGWGHSGGQYFVGQCYIP